MAKKTTKKYDETLVNVILDKSGSMSSIKKSTIDAFNEYVSGLKKDGNKYSFSLVLFDTEFTDMYTNVPISKVKELTEETFQPDGMTALYDAVCLTIRGVEKTVKKNQKVLTVIITDGGENSSKEFTQDQLKAKIEELQGKGNWSFVFLGANQNSWVTASAMGVPTMNTANFAATGQGVVQMMQVVTRNTSAFAGGGGGATAAYFSAADQQNLNAGIGQTGGSGTAGNVADLKASAHFSSLGKKSWEARKRKMFE